MNIVGEVLFWKFSSIYGNEVCEYIENTISGLAQPLAETGMQFTTMTTLIISEVPVRWVILRAERGDRARRMRDLRQGAGVAVTDVRASRTSWDEIGALRKAADGEAI